MLGFAVPQFGASATADGYRFAATAEQAGRDPANISPYVRINVSEGATVGQVAGAVHELADNGYPDAFVDLAHVTKGTDACLHWVEQLLRR